MVMDKYQPFTPKYVYKGLTLRQYCLKNDLSYYSIVSFVKRKLAKNSKKTIDELINEGINIINRYGIVYYYKGIPLKDYAKEHNLTVATIRVAVLKKTAIVIVLFKKSLMNVWNHVTNFQENTIIMICHFLLIVRRQE